MSLVSAGAVLAVARRPALWTTAVKAALSIAPTGWWRRRPFLPLPDSRWMHFRLETAYGGDGSQALRGEELVTWLEWRRTLRG